MHNKLYNFSFIGGMGSGKSSLANYFVKEYGYDKFSFADEVKKIALMILGYEVFDDSGNINYKLLSKEKHRTFLQQIGFLLKKNSLTQEEGDIVSSWIVSSKEFKKYCEYYSHLLFHDDFYAKIVFEGKKFKNSRHYVFDDMRFLVEVPMFKSFENNKIVLIDVPLNIRINRLKNRDNSFNPKWLEDISEKEFLQINPDKIIYNYIQSDENLSYRNIEDCIKDMGL